MTRASETALSEAPPHRLRAGPVLLERSSNGPKTAESGAEGPKPKKPERSVKTRRAEEAGKIRNEARTKGRAIDRAHTRGRATARLTVTVAIVVMLVAMVLGTGCDAYEYAASMEHVTAPSDIPSNPNLAFAVAVNEIRRRGFSVRVDPRADQTPSAWGAPSAMAEADTVRKRVTFIFDVSDGVTLEQAASSWHELVHVRQYDDGWLTGRAGIKEWKWAMELAGMQQTLCAEIRFGMDVGEAFERAVERIGNYGFGEYVSDSEALLRDALDVCADEEVAR